MNSKEASMNAKEARAKATSIEEGKNKEQYTIVQKAIREAALKGELQAHVYFNLTNWVTNKLEKEGFTVSNVSFRNETTTTISW